MYWKNYNAFIHKVAIMYQSVKEKFLRYVQIDTQSDPTSDTFPSSMKQKDLGRLLVEELQTIGIENTHIDDYGYVYATLASNDPSYTWPTIGLCSHMDTSPDASWADVQPIIHDYQWWDIILPWDSNQVISIQDNPQLSSKIWEQIITSDGTTLLWADDKAGIAEIMTALEYLIQHPEIKHGDIKICFTPDEEIGAWTDHIDLELFNPDFAYTIDGSTLGEFEYENFNAETVTVMFHGYNVHPGYAKDKLINTTRVAGEFISMLPLDHSPETTEWKQPYMHLNDIQWWVSQTTLKILFRSFDKEMFDKYEKLLRDLADQACENFPGSSYILDRKISYNNMSEYITPHPHIIQRATDAITAAGITPIVRPIRGGTDGARLSELWIPCPNLFAGWHNFHSVKEWISVQDMVKAAEVILGVVSV